MKFRLVAFLCLIAVPTSICAQLRKAGGSELKPHSDSSREPFVIKEYFTNARFEKDGTSEQDLRVRVQLESEAGIEQWSELIFSYDAANEDIEVRGVRVRKANGTVVALGADAVEDVVAPPARDFPAFANCKERHISIPSLSAGDILEYEIVRKTTKPVIPGEFWFEHRFVENAVILDERLQIDVPADLKVTLKSIAAFPYQKQLANSRAIYSWQHKSLARVEAPQPESDAAAKPPDVQLTSFAGWAEVARALTKMAGDSAEPTPEIRVKVQQLVEGRASDEDKIEAIYDYVSKNVRHVPLPIGITGYRSRSAGEVFDSQYGDSGDMHTLLAAMLRVAGIHSDRVLISPTRRLDAAVPSPKQFDEAISAVPLGKELIWMDPSVGVAPFRMLPATIRKRSALLIAPDGTESIVETPADPPFRSMQSVRINGHVSELGKLTAAAQYSLRGDTELTLRAAFRQAPQEQWKEIGQTILSLDGIRGEVTGVQTSDVTATRDPFQLEIDFVQSRFVDWSAKQTNATMPMLAIGLPDLPGDKTKAIDLGSPLTVTIQLELTLPDIFTARPPVALALTRDYADFKSRYGFSGHTVRAERVLDFKMRGLPAGRLAEYAAFARAVAGDQNQPLVVENVAPDGPKIPPNATADELVEAGRGEFNGGNLAGAIPLFERAIQLEPLHTQAWNDLGVAYLRGGKYEEAAAALKKQLAINPADEHANAYLGAALEHLRENDEAAAAFRRQIEIAPLDAAAHAALGELLLAEHDDTAATAELEKATILSPKSAALQIDLGRAYINTGANDSALAAFDRAVALSATPPVWNEIASSLADHRVELGKARQYARDAVRSTAAVLAKATLAHPTSHQLSAVSNIASYWDTLGWVYAQAGDLQSGSQYILAAWRLDQSSAAADHLAQIDERFGEKDRAIAMYSQALAAPDASPDTRARLILLLGGNAGIDELVEKALPKVESLRTFTLQGLSKEDGAADFWLLFAAKNAGNAPQLEAIQFANGSESLRPFVDKLRLLDYGVQFPDATPLKLIRRGTLSCSGKSGDCTFTLIPPDEVRLSN